MSAIYPAATIRAWDAYTIEHTPISSLNLMERAAEACVKHLVGSFQFKRIALFCGLGNNGGDGLAIARLLAPHYEVTVYICRYSDKTSADFEANYKRLPQTVTTVEMGATTPLEIQPTDLLVDCIFGSGLTRPITGWLGEVIDQINTFPAPVASVDIPSGLFMDSNRDNPLKHVIKAEKTLSFQVYKMPFFFPEYTSYIGQIALLDIGLLPDFKGKAIAELITRESVQFPPRSLFSHKGTNGYLTVIAGSKNMPGAALLATEAAFRTGCGYVGVIADEQLITPLATRLPEAIWLGENADQIATKSSAIAIGPGLGTDKKSKTLLENSFKYNLPMVLDADAINLIAAHPDLLAQLPKNSILTPHVGELKRLVGPADTTEELLEKQTLFAKKHQVYLLQKGAFSKLVTPEGNLYINSSGNPAMATAGMGDALTGITGALLAQGFSPEKAAIAAPFIHGFAGDLYVRKNDVKHLLTTDLIGCIPQAIAQL